MGCSGIEQFFLFRKRILFTYNELMDKRIIGRILCRKKT
ncbi:hypothetical protein KIS4809_4483 [Bacillus sp. ZZV12-4809]|nr:hypothetical protein KIS4809_4483 [Bacillus sp. ZZV12-4809]